MKEINLEGEYLSGMHKKIFEKKAEKEDLLIFMGKPFGIILESKENFASVGYLDKGHLKRMTSNWEGLNQEILYEKFFKNYHKYKEMLEEIKK